MFFSNAHGRLKERANRQHLRRIAMAVSNCQHQCRHSPVPLRIHVGLRVCARTLNRICAGTARQQTHMQARAHTHATTTFNVSHVATQHPLTPMVVIKASHTRV